jgi:hypothetical protein
MSEGLPTPRSTQGAAELVVTCNACLHSVYADLQRMIETGKGDVPLIDLKLVCGACGSRDVFSVVSGARIGRGYP